MLKHLEYTRHSMTEPLVTVYLYKKVEDGKIVSAFRIMVYKDTIISIYEDDKLQGGVISDVENGGMDKAYEVVKKYYDDNTDDMIIYGEKDLVDQLLEKFDQK
ncbi:hypothetical protein [Acidianus sp. HS-5]|uniref:hypothetical protein n=1 Tax=Acidianus sp. HS-5 TaxID=2886040 RepID=UPI001F2CC4CE|nr:hypothetical protein [Acidianus sp. HS-5]BDC19396.1 hypothetical protein HS5_22860 [Acidianus sp. HS-5]